MFSHPEPILCPTTLPPHSSWDPSPSMHKQHPILSVWSLYLTQKLKFFPRTLELALYISHSTFDCQSPHRTSLIGGLADNLLLDFNCTIWMVLLVLLWTTLQSPFQKRYLLSLHSLDSFSRKTKLGIRSNLLSLILLARYLFFSLFPFVSFIFWVYFLETRPEPVMIDTHSVQYHPNDIRPDDSQTVVLIKELIQR